MAAEESKKRTKKVLDDISRCLLKNGQEPSEQTLKDIEARKAKRAA